MSEVCPACNRKATSDGAVCCSSCGRLFHYECAKLLPNDVDFMKENTTGWHCSVCLQLGRKHRSGSVTSCPVKSSTAKGSSTSSSYQDQFERLFAELSSIKSLQQSIVSDISSIKETQAALSADFNAKYEKLQSDFRDYNLKLTAHDELLGAHSDALNTIENKVARIENDLVSGQGSLVHSSESVDVEEIVAEIAERQRRARNIMVFGAAESNHTSPLERRATDLQYVKQLFAFLGCTPVVVQVFRVGAYNASKKRPIKVVLQSEAEVGVLIKGAKKLQGGTVYSDVSLSFDRTTKQLDCYRALRTELNERVAKGERNIKIRFVSGNPKIVVLN